MFTVEIEGYCPKPVAPRFDTYEDAKRCYDSAVDFICRTHPNEGVHIWLFNDFDDYPFLVTFVERGISKKVE